MKLDGWSRSLRWAYSVHGTAGERHAAWGRTTNKFCHFAKSPVKFHDFSTTSCDLTRLHDFFQAWKTAIANLKIFQVFHAGGNPGLHGLGDPDRLCRTSIRDRDRDPGAGQVRSSPAPHSHASINTNKTTDARGRPVALHAAYRTVHAHCAASVAPWPFNPCAGPTARWEVLGVLGVLGVKPSPSSSEPC